VYFGGSAPLVAVDAACVFAACACETTGLKSRPPSMSQAADLTDDINDLRVVGKMYSDDESYRGRGPTAWTALRAG
jgi:hypothetical protein